MKETFVYQDLNTHYYRHGSGQPVVLLHGFGEDSSIFNNQVEALKDICEVFVPDLPGSGTSGLLTKGAGSNVTLTDYADWLHALLQHLKLQQVIVLGHSMGGYIALAYAEKYGHNLKGFGLLHSTAFADSEEKKDTRLKAIKIIEAYGSYSFLKSTIPNLFAAGFKQQHPNVVSDLIEKGSSFSPMALVQYYQMMIDRPDRTHVLKELTIPVLFIVGTEDIAAPMDDLMKQVHLPALCYVHILQAVGHMGMLEATTDFNKHLVNFITDVRMSEAHASKQFK